MKCRRKGKVKSRDKSEMRRQRVLGGRSGTSERGNQRKPKVGRIQTEGGVTVTCVEVSPRLRRFLLW
jgi:hypothetical protein